MTYKEESPRMAIGGLQEISLNMDPFDEAHDADRDILFLEKQAVSLDIRQALQFAQRLTGSANSPMTFTALRGREGDTARSKRATVTDAWPWIERQQADGWGIYITVNQTAGTDRKKTDITSVRAVWVDADAVAPICQNWPLQPHLVVESSPGKFHYYWFTDALPSPDEFKATIKAMCSANPHIGGDRNAADISRVLRLPGTMHLKNPASPHLVRIVGQQDSPKKYTWEQITQAFPVSIDALSMERARFELTPALQTIESAGEGLHAALRDIAAHMASSGVPEEITKAMLPAYAAQHSDGSRRYVERLAEVPGLIRSAYEKYALSGFSDVGANGKPSGPLNLFTSEYGHTLKFDPRHYPAIVANLAADMSRRMGCDPLIPAWTALVACAGLIPDGFKLQVKAKDQTWKESPRLWVAVVGDPSTQKSPPMSAVMVPIEDLQRRHAEQYDTAMVRWRDRVAMAKKNKDPEPDTPQMRRVLAHDATTEALALVLHSNPAGLLVVQDELSGWFGGHDAYRPSGTSKDRGFWLQAYNGASYTVDRVKGAIFVPNLSISMIGGIQPGPMRDIAAKIGDDGLLQRFICIPIRAAIADADLVPDAAALTAWRDLVEELGAVRDNGLTWPELFRLSPAAQIKADAARHRLREITTSPANDKRIAAALAKGHGQLMRLVLTFHLIENRSVKDDLFNDRDIPASTIEESTVTKAVQLFFDLVIPATFDFYSRVIGESELQRQARRVAGYILAHECETISDRDVYREALKELRDDERGRSEVMRQLELAGWIAPKKETRGRVTQWDVSQSVHTKFAAQASAERERRAQVVSEIRTNASSDK